MTKTQIDFVTCVIGALSLMTGRSCSEVYRKLQKSGIIKDYLSAAYEVLHTFSLEYVAEDVIELMKKNAKQPAVFHNTKGNRQKSQIPTT